MGLAEQYAGSSCGPQWSTRAVGGRGGDVTCSVVRAGAPMTIELSTMIQRAC